MCEVEQLKLDEKLSLLPDSSEQGKFKIGYGLNLRTGITEEEASAILVIRVRMIQGALESKLKWLSFAPVEVKNVLINMAYQLGLTALLELKRTLGFMRKEQYIEASIEMLDTDWAEEDRERSKRLSVRISDLHK